MKFCELPIELQEKALFEAEDMILICDHRETPQEYANRCDWEIKNYDGWDFVVISDIRRHEMGTCVACGHRTNEQELCADCQRKYAPGTDFLENPCPDVEIVCIAGKHGGHRHIWPGKRTETSIYWRPEGNGIIVSIEQDGERVELWTR